MQTLANGVDGIQPKVSMPRVKSILLLAFQPVASAAQTEEVEYNEVLAKGYLEFFFQNYEYMLVIALTFLMAGFILGYLFKKIWPTIHVDVAMKWLCKKVKSIFPKGHRQLCFVDDWDPEMNETRQFRILEDPEDALSGEKYFRHIESHDGLARYFRPDCRRRLKYGISELNAVEAYQFLDDDMGKKEEKKSQQNETHLWKLTKLHQKSVYDENKFLENILTFKLKMNLDQFLPLRKKLG